jgi:hypothetical protein
MSEGEEVCALVKMILFDHAYAVSLEDDIQA